ncbi:hypothetical protein WUBG_00889 [Wuchereria bancrofti]|uniref:Uncharacterized protein n=1 Tax=Wuchereria bancrofti TaxID=6293 RepID=J9BL41_WUCBA|nr:hypothetical protein WUBG_00889 [Wuchereria bancrofti]
MGINVLHGNILKQCERKAMKVGALFSLIHCRESATFLFCERFILSEHLTELKWSMNLTVHSSAASQVAPFTVHEEIQAIESLPRKKKAILAYTLVQQSFNQYFGRFRNQIGEPLQVKRYSICHMAIKLSEDSHPVLALTSDQ